jgi:UDP-GlcNAc:undecaprenyl-phosphate GlcNAc-1-phosphate transferase
MRDHSLLFGAILEGVPAVALAGLLALAIAWSLTAALIHTASRLGLVDHPDPRKVHIRPTPRAGGLAIYGAVALTGIAAAFADHCGWTLLGFSRQSMWQMAFATPMMVLGLVDDFRPLSWKLRLGVQTILGLEAALVYFPEIGVVGTAAVVVWLVGITNAFNMLDNMDMLSAGTALIACGWLAIIVSGIGQGAWVQFVILMGALTGFLWWNRPPAKIFMGDSGSTFLGFVLGLAMAQVGSNPEGPAWSWAVALCLAAVPCYDMITVVTIRLSQGRSPFHPDKQHLSHRLVDRGLSSVSAVRVIHLLALASGTSALLLIWAPSAIFATVVVGQLAVWWLAFGLIDFLPRTRCTGKQLP